MYCCMEKRFKTVFSFLVGKRRKITHTVDSTVSKWVALVASRKVMVAGWLWDGVRGRPHGGLVLVPVEFEP